MGKVIVYGGKPLFGEISITGAKNSALPVMAALVLNETKENIVIENIPKIKDVQVMKDILIALGLTLTETEEGLVCNSSGIKTSVIPEMLIREMRSSVFLMGPLLARLGKIKMGLPGGCNIGSRPIDLHLKGLKALGAEITAEGEVISAEARHLTGAKIHLDFPSVGATENIMMAAVRAQGETIIENAAKEPEIVDLQGFLNKMGGDVRGAGTARIKIKGPTKLRGGTYKIIPDRIAAGTFLMAAAITQGNILVKNVIPSHLEAVITKLREVGVYIEEESDSALRVTGTELKGVRLVTQAYPGFPTDLQAPMAALLTVARGESSVHEEIFDNRLKHMEELQKMGAKINIMGRKAVITGCEKLLAGKTVKATDLRAGAALVLAALSVAGKTEIIDTYHIDRGYENLSQSLSQLGAEVYWA